MIQDFRLSSRYTFYDLTITNNKDLLETNREEALKFKPTLLALANLLEKLSGSNRLDVNSGFRCWQLNGRTPGSSSTSQHPLGQAADVSLPGQAAKALFLDLRQRMVDLKLPFGQLIYEEAKRDHGIDQWVHISLGHDFWKPERCGEIRTMQMSPEGKPIYTLLEVIRPWAPA